MINKSWYFSPEENGVKVYMSRKNKAARCRDIKDFGKVVSIKKADMMVSEVINEMS